MLHRVVVGGVVVRRAWVDGGRPNRLLDNRLLLESVERRRVRQDPLQSAPRVATGPANAQNHAFCGNLAGAVPATLIVHDSNRAGQATSCEPADRLVWVLRVQVRHQIVLGNYERAPKQNQKIYSP